MSRKDQMLTRMPHRYRIDPLTNEIKQAEAIELDRIAAQREDVFAQFDPATATWGIVNWEKIFGFPVDETKPLQERRDRVLARLSFLDAITKETIRKVASSWLGENVAVEERFADYEVFIGFLMERAETKNFTDICGTLRELLPAHLGFGFAPASKETLEIEEKVTVNMRRYHTVREFRVGMKPMKYQNEVVL